MMSDQLSSEDFNRLLSWLGTDAETAAKKYEELRRILYKFFRYQDVPDAESLVDEVMNRAARRAKEVAPGFVGDPTPYFLVIARNVSHEWKRLPTATELPINLIDENDPAFSARKELLSKCLEECIAKQPDREQRILYRYSEEAASTAELAKVRGELAQDEGMSVSALRVMIHRLRKEIRRCIERLMAKKA